MIKLTQSVNCTLVPGDDTHTDKKGFTWELLGYDNDKILLKFNFEHPAYISTGHRLDTMRIQIFNAEKLFTPTGPDMFPIPNGYTLMQKIPPQSVGLLSEIEVQEAKETGQKFVLVNFILSLILKSTLQILLGSIITLQILAHFPLADIILPANARQ